MYGIGLEFQKTSKRRKTKQFEIMMSVKMTQPLQDLWTNGVQCRTIHQYQGARSSIIVSKGNSCGAHDTRCDCPTLSIVCSEQNFVQDVCCSKIYDNFEFQKQVTFYNSMCLNTGKSCVKGHPDKGPSKYDFLIRM